jgi:hypothetical protein
VTAGDVPQALYEARKQEYEIAVNQGFDSQTRKPRNPTKSHHPPCAEVEGAVLTPRVEPHSTLFLRCGDAETPTGAHPQRSHTSSVSTALLNHKPHTIISGRIIIARFEVLTAMLLKTESSVFYTDFLGKYPSFRRVVAFESLRRIHT